MVKDYQLIMSSLFSLLLILMDRYRSDLDNFGQTETFLQTLEDYYKQLVGVHEQVDQLEYSSRGLCGKTDSIRETCLYMGFEGIQYGG